jgi:hypothetical protein
MEQPSETIIVNSTKIQIEEFKESIIWKDMIRELLSWGEGFRRDQENIANDAARTNPSTASVLLHLGHTSGCTDAVNYIIDLPDRFLEYLKEKSENNNLEVSDGNK